MSQFKDEPHGYEGETPQGQPALQPLKFVWLALIFSVFIYALVPVLLRLPVANADPRLKAILFIALSIASLASLIAIVVIRRLGLPHSGTPVTAAPGVQPPRGRRPAIQLISWMLAETIALYGIVLYLLFHEPRHVYPFIVVALGLLILLAPRDDRSSGGGEHSELARPGVKIG